MRAWVQGIALFIVSALIGYGIGRAVFGLWNAVAR